MLCTWSQCCVRIIQCGIRVWAVLDLGNCDFRSLVILKSWFRVLFSLFFNYLGGFGPKSSWFRPRYALGMPLPKKRWQGALMPRHTHLDPCITLILHSIAPYLILSDQGHKHMFNIYRHSIIPPSSMFNFTGNHFVVLCTPGRRIQIHA